MTDYTAVLERARQFGFQCASSGVAREENPYAEATGEMFDSEDSGRLRARLIDAWFAGWDEGARMHSGRMY